MFVLLLLLLTSPCGPLVADDPDATGDASCRCCRASATGICYCRGKMTTHGCTCRWCYLSG